MGKGNRQGDIDDISTWTRYEPWFCETCRGNCCRMPVEVTLKDLVRMGALTETEAKWPIEELEGRLRQDGIIEHRYVKERIFILAHIANGDCIYQDPVRRTCRIYAKRPDTCREYPNVGLRPGFCAYERK